MSRNQSKWILVFVFGIACLVLSACRQEQTTLAKRLPSKNELPQTPQWVTTWSQAQKGIAFYPQDDGGHTLLYEVPVQNAGDDIRLTLGDYYGDQAMSVQEVSVSTNKNQGYQKVSFDGKRSVTVPKQSLKKSDPVRLKVQTGSVLYVRMAFPKGSSDYRLLSGNRHAKVIRSTGGNQTAGGRLTVDKSYGQDVAKTKKNAKYGKLMKELKLRFATGLQGVDVRGRTTIGTIVAFGDSITEQNHWVGPLTSEVNRRWNGSYSVINMGISGNRLLRSNTYESRSELYQGLAGVERFEHDVFGVNANVKAVILALGVNDIHQPGDFASIPYSELPTEQAMIQGYQKLIQTAKKHHARVFLATITPFTGYGVNSHAAAKEKLRQKVNQWIRQNKQVDGVIDYDKLVANPKQPYLLSSVFDSGDHLHPNARGGAKMEALIPVQQLIGGKEEEKNYLAPIEK